VAGFDLTFSVPKSVFTLWALTDPATQGRVYAAHQAAMAQTLTWLEENVVASRAGHAGVAQVGVRGLIATGFDHWESRAGDPQLHTHMVISNRVQRVSDRQWVTLDSYTLHRHVVAASEIYNGLLFDEVARRTGAVAEQRGGDTTLTLDPDVDAYPVTTQTTDPAADPSLNARVELEGIPDELISLFSSRAEAIRQEKDRLIAEYQAEHGHAPSNETILKLRQQATLSTRHAKDADYTPLHTRMMQWRTRAVDAGFNPARIVAATLGNNPVMIDPDQLPTRLTQQIAAFVLGQAATARLTFTKANLTAATHRLLQEVRCASPQARPKLAERIITEALHQAVKLSPTRLGLPAHAQDGLTINGRSVFENTAAWLYTTQATLDTEAHLQAAATTNAGPRLEDTAELRELLDTVEVGDSHTLAPDQNVAAHQVLTSTLQVTAIIGPAGTGKTTAMRALRTAWEAEHGKGSVVGLAPSAGAAEVLAVDLGIATENTAKWWQNHLTHGDTFHAGQLVILDEASLAGTHSLDRITGLAASAGAKVLLVGDWAQLQSIDAGGAFGLLAHAREDVPELTDVHRFTHDWEKHASLQLRHGNTDIIDTYLEHERITDGDTEDMIDDAYTAWKADRAAGLALILISDSNESVTALNERARTDLILAGIVGGPREAMLHEEARAAAGDTIITRKNDRRLTAGHGWVRNGDRWTVLDVRSEGSLLVQRAGAEHGSKVVLPAEYVAVHVDLGYAVTSYRAQGVTVDTAHVLVDASMTRENFYVAMTRGRQLNQAYVAVDRPDDAHEMAHPADNAGATGRSVLYGVLQHQGGELSAHETLTVEQERWGTIAQLAAEYDTLAAAAQHDRWVDLIRHSGLTDAEAESAIGSDAFGPLTAELRRAEAHSHDLDSLVPRLVAARQFDDADDIAAVLRYRLAAATNRYTGSGRATAHRRAHPRSNRTHGRQHAPGPRRASRTDRGTS